MDRLHFERCDPYRAAVEELVGTMDELDTLDVVSVDPYPRVCEVQIWQA